MSRNAKIVVGLVAGLLLLCVCGAVATFGVLGSIGFAAARTVRTDAASVAVNAGQIADFQLPAGYRPEATFDLGGFAFVSYSPGDGHSHIMFVQAPTWANVDQATLEQYAQQAGTNSQDDRRSRSTRTVGQIRATLRGQPVTLVVQEGTNSDGGAYRSVTGVFAGNGGTALVSVESPVSSWNQAEVDAFLASIH